MHLLGCVLLLLHPGTLGDDELMAALVDDTRTYWKHSNNIHTLKSASECGIIASDIPSLVQ